MYDFGILFEMIVKVSKLSLYEIEYILGYKQL